MLTGPEPGDRLGGYDLVDRLGQGGMGVVFLARPARGMLEGLLGRADAREGLVALKVIAPGLALADGAIERFAKEHEILTLLDHPNLIAPLGPLGTDRGVRFFAMEYVEGKSLGHLLKERGRLEPLVAATAVREMLRALGAAHREGVVHRDVKPTNVLVSRGGAVKVCDFGLAHVVEWTRLTIGSGALGTPSYMAPEQIDERAVDPRSDLYATAAVLFELLSGRPPFEAQTPMAVMLKHLDQDPPSVSEVTGDPSLACFDALLKRGLAKDPDARFASAADFEAALGEVVPGLAGSGRALALDAEALAPTPPLGSLPGVRRRRRRRRAMVLGGIVLGVGVVLGGRALLDRRDPPPPPAPAGAKPEPAPEPAPRVELELHEGGAVTGRLLERRLDAVIIEDDATGGRREVPMTDIARMRFLDR